MKCQCGSEIVKNDEMVWCPKCGWSFTIERIKAIYEFIYGRK